jgi:hypothetical protein
LHSAQCQPCGFLPCRSFSAIVKNYTGDSTHTWIQTESFSGHLYSLIAVQSAREDQPVFKCKGAAAHM